MTSAGMVKGMIQANARLDQAVLAMARDIGTELESRSQGQGEVLFDAVLAYLGMRVVPKVLPE